MINAVVAIGQTEWEAQFVSGLAHPMTGFQIQRRCVDAVDALAVTKVISCDLVVISDHTLRVDPEFVNEVLRQGIRLVALTSQPTYFQNLGVRETVALDLTNPLTAIPGLSALARVSKTENVEVSQPTGELIFVGGFGGATGKTRLAAELAWQFSSQGKLTLLVDGDTYGPALTQTLGLAPTTFGLLELCRKIERKTVGESLFETSVAKLNSNLDFVGGITKNSRWIDLRPVVVSDFWQLAKTEYQKVIVDGGPVIEVEPLLAIESGIAKRNLVANSALQSSQQVILTCLAHPINLTRLIKGLVENAALFENKELSIALLAASNKKQTKDALHTIATHTECENIFVIESNNDLVDTALSQSAFVSAIGKSAALCNTYLEISKEIYGPKIYSDTAGRLDRMFPKRHALASSN